MAEGKRDWARIALIVALLAIGVAIGAILNRPKDGISQECFVAIQLRLAETSTDDRQPIPDDELDRVCPGWTRFSVPSGE